MRAIPGPPLEARARPRAVSFDFYGTLAGHGGTHGRGAALRAYMAESGLSGDPWRHQVLYDVFASVGREYSPRLSSDALAAFQRRFSRELFRLLDIRPADAADRHARNIWHLMGPASLRIYDDVLPALGALRRLGVPAVIVSNWPCGLAGFCEHLGLGPFVAHVLASAEVGSVKPDAAIYLEAARRIALEPSEILHVGDSPVDDVEGATAAGFRAVLLRRDRDERNERNERNDQARVITGLDDVVGLLAPSAAGPSG